MTKVINQARASRRTSAPIAHVPLHLGLSHLTSHLNRVSLTSQVWVRVSLRIIAWPYLLLVSSVSFETGKDSRLDKLYRLLETNSSKSQLPHSELTMATETEGTFTIGDVSLYTKTWTVRSPQLPAPPPEASSCQLPSALMHLQPTGPTKAKLIFLHGFSDHINRYNDFLPYLASQGIEIHGFDQRGWGRSVKEPAHKGLTGPTSRVLSDIAAFIEAQLPSPVPVFVMGHSMGGGEALSLACTPEYAELVSKIRGWVLEAPFLAFPEGEEPSSLKVFMGRLVGRLLPRQHLVNKIPAEYLSRDPAWQKSVDADTLCHDTGTLEGLAGMLDRTSDLGSGKLKLSRGVKAMFVAHGTADRVTSFKASKAWFGGQEMDDAEFKEYEGCLHQLHADHCKDEFSQDVSKWILDRAERGDGGAGTPSNSGSKL